jgi:hypothetical protein
MFDTEDALIRIDMSEYMEKVSDCYCLCYRSMSTNNLPVFTSTLFHDFSEPLQVTVRIALIALLGRTNSA